ncbi:MAG: PQQ-binding-like beta-propeller repeat protein [Planctomycetaceae bacterium]|nr:PQQ-binding-like beta-propeller repeat protein [Planctomycetaceae bacterium]
MVQKFLPAVLVALLVNSLPLLAEDWPTYMHDAARTGESTDKLPGPLALQWVYTAAMPPAPAWPDPAKDDVFHSKKNLAPDCPYDRAFQVVSAGGRVFFGSSADDKVHCLDAATGKELWTFATEGPVRLAPTVVGERVIVGSDDGCVYALKAADGALIWKLRATDKDRRIAGNGRIISLWPLRASVLVSGNVAYFCAGLFPTQGGGVYVVTADVATGKKLSEKSVAVSAQGYLRLQKNQVFAPAGRTSGGVIDSVAVPAAGSILKHEPCAAAYPYCFIGTDEIRIAGGDGEVAAFKAKNKIWTLKVEGKAWSLAVAGGKLLVSTDAGKIYCFAPGSGAGTTVQAAAPKAVAADEKVSAAAKDALAKAQTDKGYALVIGGPAELACEVARQSKMQVVMTAADAPAAGAARKIVDARGMTGRVSVHEASPDKLPYSDYLFNLVIGGSSAEAQRVTRPCGGVAIVAGKPIIRGPLAGAGEWTHCYADAGNSTCSGETLVGAGMEVQWFGLPGPRNMADRHNRAAAPLYRDGRLFVSGFNYLACVDSYNGAMLWEHTLPNSVRLDTSKSCGNMAVAGDLLYIAVGGTCEAYDVQSGEKKLTVAADSAGKACEWGYVATVGDALFGSVCRPGAHRREVAQSTWQFSYNPLSPMICSETVFAVDRRSGTRLWTYRPQEGLIVNTTIAVADGRMYFIESTNPKSREDAAGRVSLPVLMSGGGILVALDVRDGKVLYRQKADLEAAQHMLFLSVAGGVIVTTDSRTVAGGKRGMLKYDLQAFDAASGNRLWKIEHTGPGARAADGSHGENAYRAVIIGERLFIPACQYELKTGKAVPNWQWSRNGGGCGAVSASAKQVFNRGGNPQMTDLSTPASEHLTTATRPGCWINIIPAGGMVLMPEASSGCTCPYPVQGSVGMIPKR